MESTVGKNAENETIKRVVGGGYREEIKKQLDDEIKKITDVETQKAARAIIEEHKNATRKMVEECKSVIRQIVEEEKQEILL